MPRLAEPARQDSAAFDAGAFRARLAREAASLGFDAFGITAPDAISDAPLRLKQFLDNGRHGAMDWLAASPERRSDPRVLWSEVRSVVMLGMNYGPAADPLAILAQRARGAISVYAQGDDYHDLIKARLKELARWMIVQAGGDVKVFVDTAAVMEKPLAEAAGLGWQGKHTNLVSRDFGSWLFLGAIFTTLDLPRATKAFSSEVGTGSREENASAKELRAPSRSDLRQTDSKAIDHCGSCRACLDICPTAAFPAPYLLDARRCISYLTIENKGPIPREFRRAIGNRIYGCDDCLAACPWNKFAQQGREAKLAAREALRAPKLAELAALDDASFRALFSKSPVKRIGRDRFVRNVLIAIGNSGEQSLATLAVKLLGDDSALVRGAAVWALAQLLLHDDFAALGETRLPNEIDADVRGEWQAALSAF